MNMEIVTVPSYWGTPMQQKHITVQGQTNKLVVLFPGRGYSCELPLLYYAGNAALQHNHSVLKLEYGYQAARASFDLQDLSKVIDECTESVLQVSPNYDQLLFISKSMGTIVAGEVHRRMQQKVNHIFLTPLVETIPYINASDRVVIYGGMDPAFPSEAAKQIEYSENVIEIPRADHGLETGDVEENLAILKRIAGVYQDVLARIRIERGI
ncbi:alpha/beta hydrolase [Paenibacillus soyae]|uniref:Alpha/beta hydrolase n=1 Tax=Paenibacillus soyae TaxID=2969249 RepID=A0A9X2MVZ8_9BACL|nr:alpha/beta hydrolase [Paenibacillus soyae]MCR2806913.1 alpha/beta hydrolase [Paenibacillus soyae]